MRWHRRRWTLVMTLVGTLLLTACGAKGPATPVSAPAPVQPPSAKSPEPDAPPASKSAGLELLTRLQADNWRLDAITSLLPPIEGEYQALLESPNYIEYAYASGALRLFVSPKGGQVFALLADTSNPAYAAYGDLAATDRYAVVAMGPRVVVCRSAPLDQPTFAAIASRSWTSADLQARLGEASYAAHVHGVGSDLLTYIPQGLTFVGEGSAAFRLMDPKQPMWNDPHLAVTAPTYTAYRGGFADGVSGFGRSMASKVDSIITSLTNGKSSPSGRFRAAAVSYGGYWDNWIYVQRPEKAEIRINADYFILGFEWLDDHRVVYVPAMAFGDAYPFYAIDAITGQKQVIAQLPNTKGLQISSFGVAGPGRLWYKTHDGVRQELTVGK